MTGLAMHSDAINQKSTQPILVDVADFSATPGGRYRRHGPFSGQDFRESVLAPKLREAIARGQTLRVRIDGVQRSYQSSFLDEAFAGLIREEGFSRADVQRFLKITSSLPRFEKYKALAERYIEEA